MYALGYLSTCVVCRSRSGHARLLVALALIHTLTACTTTPAVQSPSTPTPQSEPIVGITGSPAQIAADLIVAEREAARAGDLDLLAELWAHEARITDGRGTEDPSDDYRWLGRVAILDRYIIAVLPSPPSPLDPDTLAALDVITSTDDTVVAELGVDRWRLARQDGRWRLAELRYN